MTERTDPPSLYTALEIERLRARLDAQDARIAELHEFLRPCATQWRRRSWIAARAHRFCATIAGAIAAIVLAIVIGVASWPHLQGLAAIADLAASLSAGPATAPSRGSGR